MQVTHIVDQGIRVSFDEEQWERPRRTWTRVRFAGARVAPRAAAFAAGDDRTDWIVDRFLAAGGSRSATRIPMVRTDAARMRAAAVPASHVSVPLAQEERAVVMVEAEGMVTWRFPDDVEALHPQAVRTQDEVAAAARALWPHAMHEAHFTILVPGESGVMHSHAAAAAAPLHGITVTVLKWIARHLEGGTVAVLEHARRTGPVVIDSPEDPQAWSMPSAFPAPGADPARVLLFVHGTFSTTAGAFGDLCATAGGRAFLQSARSRYDAIWGWDHRTLSVDPLANARQLHAALAATGRALSLDIVCHSRGGLVVRALIEELLPGATWRAQIGRVIFVGAANSGTELARPANWRALLDLETNLALAHERALWELAAPRVTAAAEAAIDDIADLVTWLVEAGLESDAVPGLAAMNPDGTFVRTLNQTQPGQPRPGDCDDLAVTSDFHAVILDEAHHLPAEFPRRLALLLAAGFVDALMRGAPNDLVIDVASMTRIDPPARFVKDVLDFGRNARVHHRNYFLQPETIEALARWLDLAGGAQEKRGGVSASPSSLPALR